MRGGQKKNGEKYEHQKGYINQSEKLTEYMCVYELYRE